MWLYRVKHGVKSYASVYSPRCAAAVKGPSRGLVPAVGSLRVWNWGCRGGTETLAQRSVLLLCPETNGWLCGEEKRAVSASLALGE